MRSEITIHLSKLDANLHAIKSRLKPGVKVMAVIKDDAYGHGAVQIAKHLSDKVEWFCVATLREAVELREAEVENSILVFEIPLKEDAQKYRDYNITASVSDLSTFELLEEGTEYHLNFDTGMRRLGIPSEEAELALQKFKLHKNLNCTGIYTHFSSSDEPKGATVEQQLADFREVSLKFPDSLMRHTANTGAIFYYQDLDLQFDAVRPGVCLYGYMAGKSRSADLSPIIEWKSYLMQVRKIKKGESVGYGETWIAPSDGLIGTIPIGYGDGVQRILSGKFEVEINDTFIQQVGRISMDYIGVFSKSNNLKKGDEVKLFNGDSLNPQVWADLSNTIAYEVTTGINKKVKRVYVLN